MKTVCKKLLSLMLVAVLLVSAVPMMASAKTTVAVNVFIDDQPSTAKKSVEVDGSVVLSASLAAGMLQADKEFAKWVNPEGTVVTDYTLNEADLQTWKQTKGQDFYLDLYVTRVTSSGNQGTSEPTTTPTTAPTTAKNYTITFNVNGNVTQQVYQQNAAISFPTVNDTQTTYFMYWKDQNGATYAVGSTPVCNGEMTYTAEFGNKTVYNFVSGNNGGNTATVYAKPGETVTCPTAATVDGMTFKGWYTASTGGASIGNSFTAGSQGTTYYAQYYTSNKFPYSVILHIYPNGTIGSPMKTVTLDTWTCVKDGVITLDEVKEVVKTYYTAKTSDGIGYDGLYYSTSTTKTDYAKDNSKAVKSVDNLDELRTQGYVHLNVWINNYVAKSSSSSNADSSNPKTGDSIYTAVAVMGLSVTALAAVYFINKKRIAY